MHSFTIDILRYKYDLSTQPEIHDKEVKDYFETPVGFKTRARDIEISKTDQKPNDQHGAIKKGSID